MVDVENGNLGVVKGISFAIERLVGIGELPPDKGYVLKDTLLTISLDVVVRGILSALVAKDANSIIVGHKHMQWLYQQINTQIEAIHALSNNTPNLTIRVHTTMYEYIESGSAVNREINRLCDKAMHKYKNSLSTFKKGYKVDLIMTNNPFDLFNVTSQLVMNTHTGSLLNRYELSGKLRKGKYFDTSTFPFNRTIVMVFGERYRFYIGIYKIRKQAYQLLKGKVNPTTSEYTVKKLLKGLI